MDIVILCAGQGTRMNSSVPKALTLFQGKPFIDHIVSKCQSLTFHHLYIILQSKEKDHFEHLLHPYQVRYIYQDQALGTGHALQCLFQQVSYSDISDSLLILNGDMPNIYIPMIQEMINQTSNVLACRLENPYR